VLSHGAPLQRIIRLESKVDENGQSHTKIARSQRSRGKPPRLHEGLMEAQKRTEATLLGIGTNRHYVGNGPGNEMLESRIEEGM